MKITVAAIKRMTNTPNPQMISTKVFVVIENKNPDLDLSKPDPDSLFLNLLFVANVVKPENIKYSIINTRN